MSSSDVRLLVEEYDLMGLYNLVLNNSISCLNNLYEMKNCGYVNRGTVMHWAVWDRHWDIISFCASCNANFNIKGEGIWMNNKTVEEYAELLDRNTNHSYYSYLKELKKAINKSKSTLYFNVFSNIHQWNNVTLQDLQSLKKPNIYKIRLHDLIENNSIQGLQLVLNKFDNRILQSILVYGEDGIKINQAPIAHWAIWYNHFKLLEWLFQNKCVDLHITGKGYGWTNNKNLEDYAKLLESNTGHKYYQIEDTLNNLITKYNYKDMSNDNKTKDSDDNTDCVICTDNTSSYAYIPCGHLCVCKTCSQLNLKTCPMCRTAVSSVVKIFKV